MSDNLAQQMRDESVWWPPSRLTELCTKGADRIEELQKFRDLYPEKLGELLAAKEHIKELEKTIWTMHGEAHEHIKRIEALEAALREIINWQDVSAEGVGLTLALKKIQGMREIARRALEEKS